MKPFSKILVLLLLMSVFSFAQEAVNNSLTSKIPQEIVVASLSNASLNLKNKSIVSNSILIKQIGNNNYITSNLTSNTSNVNLFQIGNLNTINLNVSAKDINESILQYGNNNSFSIYSFSKNNVHDIEVVQRGDFQNLTWFGDNLISEKLKFTMQGHSKSLIVKNYK